MSRAVLEFDLEEEREEFMHTIHGHEKYTTAMAVIQDFDNWLRSQIKHTDRTDRDTLEDLRSKLYEIADHHDMRVWE